MCGIIGYHGNRPVADELLRGLSLLEYRGYDSWGVAINTPDKIFVKKQIGAISKTKAPKVVGGQQMGIAHTRWATHGGVTQHNAHPHLSSDGSFVVAQNGIAENYLELKSRLKKKGYKFTTQTDTEVIVRLIEEKLEEVNGGDKFITAVRLAFLDLEGRNTIIVLNHKSGGIIAIRFGSPLVAGQGKDGYWLASDTLPLSGQADKIWYLDNLQMARIYKENGDSTQKIEFFDVKTGKNIKLKSEKLDQDSIKLDKEGYDHFMLKEIVEQRYVVSEATSYSEKELEPLMKTIRQVRRVYVVGAGTAAFAAGQIARYLRVIAGVQAQELRSYESDSFLSNFSKKDLLLVVSQSGETADTLEVVEYAKKIGMPVASVVNMVASTMSRMSDYQYFSRSGPEICVASTKAYTSQIAWGYLLAKSLKGEYKQAKAQIKKLAKKLDQYLQPKNLKKVSNLSKKFHKPNHFFVLGKDQHFYTALEGALKIKEITYKHFEGFSAGELKHGVIALIEKGSPVFVIVGDDEHKADLLSAAAEVKARGAWVIGIAKDNHEFFDDYIATPDGEELDTITKVVPFQLISYYLGVQLGNDPDRPRNLAKSVTVK